MLLLGVPFIKLFIFVFINKLTIYSIIIILTSAFALLTSIILKQFKDEDKWLILKNIEKISKTFYYKILDLNEFFNIYGVITVCTFMVKIKAF